MPSVAACDWASWENDSSITLCSCLAGSVTLTKDYWSALSEVKDQEVLLSMEFNPSIAGPAATFFNNYDQQWFSISSLWSAVLNCWVPIDHRICDSITGSFCQQSVLQQVSLVKHHYINSVYSLLYLHPALPFSLVICTDWWIYQWPMNTNTRFSATFEGEFKSSDLR